VNIAFRTTEEPLYLPTFFELVLPVLARRHLVRVFSVRPQEPKFDTGGTKVSRKLRYYSYASVSDAPAARQASRTVDRLGL
jgi:hypothetical protein